MTDEIIFILIYGLIAAGIALLARALPWPTPWALKKPLACPACMGGWSSMAALLLHYAESPVRQSYVGLFCYWLAIAAVSAIVFHFVVPPVIELPGETVDADWGDDEPTSGKVGKPFPTSIACMPFPSEVVQVTTNKNDEQVGFCVYRTDAGHEGTHAQKPDCIDWVAVGSRPQPLQPQRCPLCHHQFTCGKHAYCCASPGGPHAPCVVGGPECSCPPERNVCRAGGPHHCGLHEKGVDCIEPYALSVDDR